jgi:hypothetical protein
MEILVKFADDHSTELLAALGKLVAAFGDLEQVLWLTPKRIRNIKLAEWEKALGSPRAVREIRRNSSVPKMAGSIRETNEKHHGALVSADLDALLSEVTEINKERHEMIHALWVRDMEGNVLRIRLSKSLPADVDTVCDLVTRVRRLRDRINDYPWTQPQ